MSDEQISILGFESPEVNELRFLRGIADLMRASIENQGGDPEQLIIKPSKPTKFTSGGYTAVKLENFTAFRLKLRGAKHYIAIPSIFSDLLPDPGLIGSQKADGKYLRLSVNEQHPIDSYVDFLLRIVGETVNRYPKEWDCCSLYMECSNAKTCVHPNKSFALGCGYRKILNSGKIFFGENRNID